MPFNSHPCLCCNDHMVSWLQPNIQLNILRDMSISLQFLKLGLSISSMSTFVWMLHLLCKNYLLYKNRKKRKIPLKKLYFFKESLQDWQEYTRFEL